MPALNLILSEMVAAGVLSPARYYVYFDGNSYLEFSPISLTGDYTITFSAYFSGNSSSRVFGNTDTVLSRFAVFSNGAVYFLLNNNALLTTPAGVVPTNRIVNVKLNAVNGTGVHLYIDSELVYTMVNYGDLSLEFKNIGAQNTGSSVSISSGDYYFNFNFDNKRIFKLNENVSQSLIFKDSLDVGGAQLWEQGELIGVVSGYDPLAVSIPTDVGKYYLVEFDYNCTNQTRIRFGEIYLFSGIGHFRQIIRASGTSAYFQGNGATENNYMISNISIKETTAAKGFNFQESSFVRSLPNA